MKQINGMMMQYFEWYLDCNQNLWNIIREKAEKLARIGVTSLWLPPAYKGAGGKYEVGYGAYDLYDLGEFNQKDTVKTKYGSKDEYLECIDILKNNGIEVYADIVLNHKMGADAFQLIPATKMDFGDHNRPISDQETVKVATKFTFPGRNNKYSDFKWNWTHFTGVDYDDNTGEHAIFKFKDKNWGGQVDEEFGNFDYLMGADLDFSNQKVVEECLNWGKWYLEETGVDGFRLDAIKHIPAAFYKEWIKALRQESGKDLFTVGEYWTSNVEKLHRYLTEVDGEISLFDVPLHFNMYSASLDENYDLTKIFDNTLVKDNPNKAVTFVDNHDTQPSQALQSFVSPWFKQAAYSIILLRESGYPCVFYGDYYGIPHDNVEKVKDLRLLMELRKERAYGEQHDYLDHPNVIGWTREGNEEILQSGLAVLISNKEDAEKMMYIGKQFIGETFIDALGNCSEEIKIDETGSGLFKVKSKSASVWVRK
ncbi:MAG: alpha-amylase [Clostridia bacterium]|nr:alpha-amylase [Clostridia bacterium]